MAIFTTFNNERPMLFGRSGYNSKPNGGDDDEDKNQGRSGYNSKPNGGGDDNDDDKNHGRSGYNSKPDGSDDSEEKKRTLNFA
ncbi:unnamed protein product [Discula destructiva]